MVLAYLGTRLRWFEVSIVAQRFRAWSGSGNCDRKGEFWNWLREKGYAWASFSRNICPSFPGIPPQNIPKTLWPQVAEPEGDRSCGRLGPDKT